MEVASGTIGFIMTQINAVRTRFFSLSLLFFIFSCLAYISERLSPPSGPWHPRAYALPTEQCWWNNIFSVVFVTVPKLSLISRAWLCAHPWTYQGSMWPEEISDCVDFCCMPTHKASILDQPHINHMKWGVRMFPQKNTRDIIIRRKKLM